MKILLGTFLFKQINLKNPIKKQVHNVNINNHSNNNIHSLFTIIRCEQYTLIAKKIIWPAWASIIYKTHQKSIIKITMTWMCIIHQCVLNVTNPQLITFVPPLLHLVQFIRKLVFPVCSITDLYLVFWTILWMIWSD